jgi:hypothetical protein
VTIHFDRSLATRAAANAAEIRANRPGGRLGATDRRLVAAPGSCCRYRDGAAAFTSTPSSHVAARGFFPWSSPTDL